MLPRENLRRSTKNGAPRKAVITPIGNSPGAIIVLEKVSARHKNEAPKSADNGIIIL